MTLQNNSLVESDVLIVGGGPAGSTCARQLVQQGFRVLVLDKAEFPRDKTCAGWITPSVVDLLDLNPDDYRRQRRWQPITGFRCGMIGGRHVDLNYGRPVSYGIRRCEFDHYLLARSGAQCVLGERVNAIERVGDRWVINQRFAAPMLVGAGGHFCPVGRLLRGAAKPTDSVVVAQEIEFAIPVQEPQPAQDSAKQGSVPPPADIQVQAEVPEIYFCQDLKGYGWCFRKQDYLNVGLGRADAADLSTHVADFCRWLQLTGRIVGELSQRFHGHAYRLYNANFEKLSDDGLLLVGDSAGLAYFQSGEGIRPAVESGLMAAEVIRQAAGDYSRPRLQSFESRIRDRFGPTQSTPPWAPVIPAQWLATVAAQLVPTRWFARNVILDRWFLRSQENPLAV